MYDHFSKPPQSATNSLGTLLDVTLRDGGFEVDFHWPNDVFASVPAALGPLGVEIIELGYIGGIPLEHGVARPGLGAYLTPEHVEAGHRDGLQLAAMVHPTALGSTPNLKPYVAAGLDMLRLVYHPDWSEGIAALAKQASELGLATTINIALASRYPSAELCDHAAAIQESMRPNVLYIADTCGALLPHQVEDLVTRLRDVVGAETEIGFHAHDFLSLAYANALSAVRAGATYIDCSLLGLGRGGGNLAAELVLLRHRLHGYSDPTALPSLLECRARLASITGRPVSTLVPAVCGALNLTPVEEHALRQFAEEEGLDVDRAALWLVTAYPRLAALRIADLREAWLSETVEH